MTTNNKTNTECCAKCETLKKENGRVCCRWCCTATHKHIECSDSTRCHCPCHQPNTERTVDEVIDGLIEQIGIASFGGVAFVPSAKYRENLTDILKPALLAERQRAEVEKAELVREILNLPDFKSLIALAHPYAETLPDGERNTHFCKVTHQLEKALKAIATRNNIQV